jgi:hypothetical protein
MMWDGGESPFDLVRSTLLVSVPEATLFIIIYTCTI